MRVSDDVIEEILEFITIKRTIEIRSALLELLERREAAKTPQKTVQEQWCGKDEPIIPDFAQRQVDAWNKEKG